MNDVPSCETTCNQPCEETCSQATTVAPLTLREVLARFDREAEKGVCDTGRYRCPYFVWGEGPPLLLMHGLADNRHAFLWLSAYLSSSYRCIGYDLPMGRDDGANLRATTHQGLADDVFALLDHLCAERAYVFATSFGTTVALRAMHDQPQRIPRAILQGALARQPLTMRERTFARFLSHWPGSLGQLPFRERLMGALHQSAFTDATMERWRYHLDYSAKIPLKSLGRHGRMLHKLDLTPLLPSIRQPTLLVQGERDPLIRPESINVLLRDLPTVGFAQVPDAGHLPCLSHPEELSRVVRHFLTPPEASCTLTHAGHCEVVRVPSSVSEHSLSNVQAPRTG